MIKLLRIMLLLCAVGLLFTACGQDEESNADTAILYIEALNRGDVEDASNFVCEEREDEITEGLMSVGDENPNVIFDNLSCEARGEDARCSYTIRQDTANVQDTGRELLREVIFNFEDGKICGFEEPVGG